MSLNFKTLKMLHEEENVIGEEPETCDLLFPDSTLISFCSSTMNRAFFT